ncbi:MAG: HEAT repeat domain-containing protein [Candidatus Poribacteria bacterium]|nr:HEAT repeat domain-containing protein [Candidatus Poribacteria bacterium]
MMKATMRPPALPDDALIQSFIQNGYVTLRLDDMPRSFHDDLYRDTLAVFEKECNPGNNLIPRLPETQEILDHPVVNGALIGLLGGNWYLHPHRHCHFNPPGSPGQGMHKDSWAKRHHHTRWMMAFYYPQDTPVEKGPTGILSGSQYYNRSPNGSREWAETPLVGEAGTVTLVHYDLWHRGMPNLTDTPRLMMKFLMVRMEEPSTPTWSANGSAWDGSGSEDGARFRHLWRWYRGEKRTTAQEINGDVIAELSAEDESVALNAAYRLAEASDAAIPDLVKAIQNEDGSLRRNAAYALSALGESSVEPLTALARHDDAGVRASVIDALGDVGLAAERATPTLIDALADSSVEVRRVAAEGLGIVSQRGSEASDALAHALTDSDEWVRRNASIALCRLGEHAASVVPSLAKALDDPTRYVRANAAHALGRIGSDDALDAAIRHLKTARWCADTDSKSTF